MVIPNFIHPTRLLFLCVFLIPVFIIAAPADVHIDSINVHNGELCISHHVVDLLDAKAVVGLQNGFTTLVLHQLFLWKRKGLFSQQVVEKLHPIRLSFDRWEQKFLLEAENETRRTKNVSHLQNGCANLVDFPLCRLDDLSADAEYYVSINVILQPVSAETYQELRAWLSRSRGTADSSLAGEKQRGRFFSLLLNVLGYGDRFYTCKSQYFQVSSRGVVDLR
jgi:hypothetical protein